MAGSSSFGNAVKYGLKAWNVVDPYLQYRDKRKQGTGFLSAVAQIGISKLVSASSISTPLGIASKIEKGLEIANAVGNINSSVSNKAYKENFGGNFKISNNGATMRQRGMNAIQNAGVTGRNALGSEAKNYHSRVHPY